MKIAWQVLRNAIAGWGRHQDGRLAAALAYYAVFSLAPLLLVVVSVLGLFIGNAQQQVQSQLRQVLGSNGTAFVNVLIAGSHHHGTGVISLIVGAALILFSAIGMFLALQNALDEVFEIHPDNKGGFIQLVVLRLHALLVVAVLAVIAVGALALGNVIGGLMQTALGGRFSGPLFEIGSGLVNVVAMTLFLAVVYRMLPQCPVSWRNARIGAAVTAVILLIGEGALSLYFTKLHPAAPYGAAGGIIVLLLWIYYSAQLMLFGAEVTRAAEERSGAAVKKAPQPPAAAYQGEISQSSTGGARQVH